MYKGVYTCNGRSWSFGLGQVVYVRNFAQRDKSKKFNPQLVPKFIKPKLIEQIGNVAYKCVDEKGNDMSIYQLKDIQQQLIVVFNLN